MQKLFENERKSMLLVCYERFKGHQEYQTILENLDSGIITSKNENISYFNSIGRTFLMDAASIRKEGIEEHKQVIEGIQKNIDKLDSDFKASDESLRLMDDNMSSKIFQL
jgi:hypothetical protein